MQSTLYPLMPIPFKPPRLVALSERQLTAHYECVYGGLVQQINALDSVIQDKTPPVASAEQCALLNAAMLHEVLGHIGTMDVCHPVVVYCLYGYQVSARATGLLREKGIDARRLSGGITAWHALGGQTETIQ